ncbi:MAG: PQQ-binding-like beta-propeller repeat protein [Acidobacteria bacterium]|nr:PQQ-binding-like beta-propeller repeat protein [Acidobacteriota bacterium]
MKRVIAVAVLVLGCVPEGDLDWPQWRGPGGLGVSIASDLPVEWSDTEADTRWAVALQGLGNSSPIVALGTVYLTEARRENPGKEPKRFSRWLLAIDGEEGGLRWEKRIVTTDAEPKHWENTFSSPTPAADRHGVYTYFGAHLARVLHTGDVDWLVEVDSDYAATSRYGAASSPVLATDVVVVLQDREWGYGQRPSHVGWIAAFDRDNGALRWQHEWTGQEGPCCTYTTPLIVKSGGGERLIVAYSWILREYDPQTGEILWSYEYTDGGWAINQLASSPVFENDLLVVSGGAHAVKSTQAFSFVASEPSSKPRLLWGDERAVPETSSPLLMDGILYTVTDNRTMSAYDGHTGRLHWRRRLPANGKYQSSLVGGAGRVYAVARRGVAVVEAGREFKLLAENVPNGRISNASLAVGAGCLLLRMQSRLLCIQRSESTTRSGGTNPG